MSKQEKIAFILEQVRGRPGQCCRGGSFVMGAHSISQGQRPGFCPAMAAMQPLWQGAQHGTRAQQEAGRGGTWCEGCPV